jgi:hypothetical protein
MFYKSGDNLINNLFRGKFCATACKIGETIAYLREMNPQSTVRDVYYPGLKQAFLTTNL